MATSAARPKRAGEDFAKQYENTSKKPKFDARNPSTLAPDAPEEDVILNADVIGKSGPQTKRNAVNIDGYESDSDNDNFDERAAERERVNKGADAANGKSKDEEQDDMFADLEQDVQGTADGDDDEDLAREGRKRKKDVRFLDQTEIEGQVMNSTSGGHVSSDLLLNPKDKRRTKDVESSSESGSDEERDMLPEEMEDDLAAEIGAGGKKRHAPKLDAFNLKAEEEEGRYDESGNYVRKAADPDAVNDSWLEGLNKKDMKKAKDAQEKRDAERRRKDAEDDATLTSDLLGRLIGGLEVGETPLEALQRLQKGQKGKGKDVKTPKWKLKKMRDRMDVDEAESNGNGAAAEDPAEAARKRAVDAITGAADALYSREQHDIYDTERESLMRLYKRETGEEWTANASAAVEPVSGGDEQWEYRWIDARDGGNANGPYDGKTMKAWVEAGYFGEGVEFRRVGASGWDRGLDAR
ncbi:hypothetical protein LTR78_006492 [Recurvomyces mirabilis]|uniref:GYF domain-containing protein n=1 Tax=Recurvomyces mirabilis TaxID=574656 RepID=A0AAE0WKW2_9PEZI|nr:hypothetical protein LTR78_006492 [Recurvomyces mirabilis]KAK5151090.1 hypothetical protein LTS14_009585 [Recurvomyces mirabilis]